LPDRNAFKKKSFASTMKNSCLVIFSLLLFLSCSKKQDETIGKSSDKLILSFALNNFSPVVTGAIDQSAKTISFTVPFGTDVTKLTPTITVSGQAAVSPGSGVAANFTNPVQYTVTAEDGSKQVYTATAQIGKSPLKVITGFALNGLSPVVNCAINDSTKTITGTVPYGTNLTALVPTITISANAAISPASGVAGNFSHEADYTVTAADGSMQVYKVIIAQAPPSGEGIAAQLIANATYPSTYGVIAQIYSAAHTFGTAWKYPNDTTVTAASANGVVPSFKYTSAWYNTQGEITSGDTLGFRNTFNFKGTGNYNDGSFYSSNYTDTGAFVLTFLYSNLHFSTKYSRAETIVAATGAKNTFTDKFTWNSTNIVVNNTTHIIMSGTATVVLQITVSGQISTYNGTITFSGNNQATLVLNSGKSYPLVWQ
jgi:hypothetical protein